MFRQKSLSSFFNLHNNKIIPTDFLNDEICEMYFDGASKGNPGQGGSGSVIYDSKGNELNKTYVLLCPNFPVTNNVAEYNGLIAGLQEAVDLKIANLIVKGDSLLIIKQMNNEYKVKNENMKELHKKAKELEKYFNSVKYFHIPREQNKVADKLSNESIKINQEKHSNNSLLDCCKKIDLK
jgi:ribonuclease HI